MKVFLIVMSTGLALRYIILPGLTMPNTFVNVLTMLSVAVLGSILGRLLSEYIKKQVNKLN